MIDSVLYPSGDLDEWCERYKIEIIKSPCTKCNKSYPFTKAFAAKGYRGVTQEPHDCGPEYVQSIFRPIGESEKEWIRILMGVDHVE